jgi:hypothetical protein
MNPDDKTDSCAAPTTDKAGATRRWFLSAVAATAAIAVVPKLTIATPASPPNLVGARWIGHC